VRKFYGIEDEDKMIDKDAYPGRQFLLSLFSSAVREKQQGLNIITYFILPAVTVALLTLVGVWILISRVTRKLFAEQRTTTSKVTTPSHPPRPSSPRKTREKVE